APPTPVGGAPRRRRQPSTSPTAGREPACAYHHASGRVAAATAKPTAATTATRTQPAWGTTPIQRAARITSRVWPPSSHGPGLRLRENVGSSGRRANHGASPVHSKPPTAAHGRPAAPLRAAHPTTAATPRPAVGAQRSRASSEAAARPVRPPPASSAGPVSGTAAH